MRTAMPLAPRCGLLVLSFIKHLPAFLHAVGLEHPSHIFIFVAGITSSLSEQQEQKLHTLP